MTAAIRFAVMWLAAWCQVIVVATMPLAAVLEPLGGAPICHAETDTGSPAPAQPTHGDHQCVLCAICQLHGGSAILVSPSSVHLASQIIAAVHFDGARPRAPPATPTIAAQPRGPPSLI